MNRVTMQNPFTEKLQSLLGQSNTAQITLANGVGKSSASISKILNGKSVPTSDTYRKIRDYLNLNEQDEAELDQAYILLHAPDIGKTKALSYKSPLKYVQERDLESCQYLDANKALLRRHVETILHELDLSFTSNHVCGARSADYLIHHNSFPACFRFSHRRRQEKAIVKKLDFIRDQAMAELADYRREVLGKQDGEPISLLTEIEGRVVATVSFFGQPQTSLSLPETAEGDTFKEKLGDARKAPNKQLQSCLAQGKATQQMTPYATLKQLQAVVPVCAKNS